MRHRDDGSDAEDDGSARERKRHQKDGSSEMFSNARHAKFEQNDLYSVGGDVYKIQVSINEGARRQRKPSDENTPIPGSSARAKAQSPPGPPALGTPRHMQNVPEHTRRLLSHQQRRASPILGEHSLNAINAVLAQSSPVALSPKRVACKSPPGGKSRGTSSLPKDKPHGRIAIPRNPYGQPVPVGPENPIIQQDDLVPSMIKIYTRLMAKVNHGNPLYFPGPSQEHHSEYRKRGVDIGDVGFVTSHGAFAFVFNICLPQDHPINPPKLPAGFEVFKFQRSTSQIYEPRTHLASQGVNQLSNLSTMYNCTEAEGAILVLPAGANLIEARNPDDLQEYVLHHKESWRKYMKGQGIQHRQLYVVTSAVKCTEWGIATFDRPSTLGNYLKFHVVDRRRVHETGKTILETYAWTQASGVIARMGPSSNLGAGSSHANQCVFFRGYKVPVSSACGDVKEFEKSDTPSSSG
ncbi:hypothetical protein AX17_001556 [Amanita inopinata Kibby_2008]|nr:hypothetical protein AX17_001556 [Amanita inopinata Kibby_2008]